MLSVSDNSSLIKFKLHVDILLSLSSGVFVVVAAAAAAIIHI